jgi:hypothetical protein
MKRAWGAAFGAGFRPHHAILSTRADASSATAPGPSCGRVLCCSLRAGQARAGRVITSATALVPCAAGRGADRLGPVRPGRRRSSPPPPAPVPVRPARCSLCTPSPVRRRALPISQLSWVSAGLPVGTPDRRHASPLMSPLGAAVGWCSSGVGSGAATGGSPSAPFKELRARGAGPITGTSAGPECWVHRIASSVRLLLRWLGSHRVGLSLDTIPPSRLGPAGRSSWAAVRPDHGQRARAEGRSRRASPSQPASGRSPRGRWGTLKGASPAQSQHDLDAAGQGTGRQRIGGPEPGWTGDSESEARLAVSDQGERARQ